MVKPNNTQLLLATIAGLLAIIAVYQQRSFSHIDAMSHSFEVMSSSFTAHLIEHGRKDFEIEADRKEIKRTIHNIDLICRYAHVQDQWAEPCKEKER